MQVTEQISLEKADEIIDRYDAEKESLIQVLQDTTSEYNWLPEPCLRRISQRLNVPLSEVFEVATFYKAFSLEPRGKHLVHVCLGTACHVRGAPQILNKIERTPTTNMYSSFFIILSFRLPRYHRSETDIRT